MKNRKLRNVRRESRRERAAKESGRVVAVAAVSIGKSFAVAEWAEANRIAEERSDTQLHGGLGGRVNAARREVRRHLLRRNAVRGVESGRSPKGSVAGVWRGDYGLAADSR